MTHTLVAPCWYLSVLWCFLCILAKHGKVSVSYCHRIFAYFRSIWYLNEVLISSHRGVQFPVIIQTVPWGLILSFSNQEMKDIRGEKPKRLTRIGDYSATASETATKTLIACSLDHILPHKHDWKHTPPWLKSLSELLCLFTALPLNLSTATRVQAASVGPRGAVGLLRWNISILLVMSSLIEASMRLSQLLWKATIRSKRTATEELI